MPRKSSRLTPAVLLSEMRAYPEDTVAEICKRFGGYPKQITRWKQDNEEFAGAYEELMAERGGASNGQGRRRLEDVAGREHDIETFLFAFRCAMADGSATPFRDAERAVHEQTGNTTFRRSTVLARTHPGSRLYDPEFAQRWVDEVLMEWGATVLDRLFGATEDLDARGALQMLERIFTGGTSWSTKKTLEIKGQVAHKHEHAPSPAALDAVADAFAKRLQSAGVEGEVIDVGEVHLLPEGTP